MFIYLEVTIFLPIALAGSILVLFIKTLLSISCLEIQSNISLLFCIYSQCFHHLLRPGTEYGLLQSRAAWRQTTARASGTQSNHRSSVRVFLAFCRRLAIHPYNTSYRDICVFWNISQTIFHHLTCSRISCLIFASI